jgi:D-alanyl-D-alanine carboxypeptidase/D-alanyl-D-alanine-endopeptidase (penicillin-binding protein 4)
LIVLELISSGLLSLWLETAGVEASASRSPLPPPDAWGVAVPQTNLEVNRTIDAYLKALEGAGMQRQDQGLWLQADITGLGSHQGMEVRRAASITKLATTLAVLDALSVDWAIETTVLVRGEVEDGTLYGQLMVSGDRDPFFVYEEALELGNALQEAGIDRVVGEILVEGDVMLEGEDDPEKVATMLRRTWSPENWTPEIESAYLRMTKGTPRPEIPVRRDRRRGKSNRLGEPEPVIVHRSLSAIGLLKHMNVYSDNILAQELADRVGTPEEIAARVAQLARVPATEIQLADGSGLDRNNQISPRAACAILAAIQRHLWPHGLTVGDVLPIFGLDGGTMEDRSMPANATAKTGTLWDTSALAGVFPTRDRGLVWFAIFNEGEDYTLNFREQQDTLLRALEQYWGKADRSLDAIAPRLENEADTRLGAPGRNRIVRSW